MPRVIKVGPMRMSHQRLNERDRAFVFQVGRFGPDRNGIHGTWEPIGGMADWHMEFGHLLQMSGRVLDPRADRRRLYAERRKRAERDLELRLGSRIEFDDEVAAQEIAGGVVPPADGDL